MTRHFILLALSLRMLLLGGYLASAQLPGQPHGNRGPSQNHAVLVELFTSEGCSSCPPADEVLRQIEGKRTDSGQLIVGVSEHVTYWNYLGWSDPFSSSVYTDRQNGYGQRFHLDSVYTPQMVINGDEQIVGSDRSGVLRAIGRQGQSSVAVHIQSASLRGSDLSLAFAVDGDIPAKGVEIFAILAEDEASSKVVRGENSGRTLAHVSVARTLAHLASTQTATQRTILIPLSTAAAQVPARGGRHLILFAQESGLGRVLGTDVSPL